MPDASGPGGNEAALRARAAELSSACWHHSMRLFPDLVMPGAKSLELLSAETERILGPLDLRGRSVLDVGTWNGHFAFEAARRGAAEVTGCDSFCWRHPVYRGRETFELARSCLGLDGQVQGVEIELAELPGALRPCDVVLFLGVFYHHYDPIDALAKVARLAREALVVETHQDLLDLDRPAMVFYGRADPSASIPPGWGPNPACVLELLESQGFQAVYYQRHPSALKRGIYHAFRTQEAAWRLLQAAPDRAGLHDLRSEEGRAAAALPESGNDRGAQVADAPAVAEGEDRDGRALAAALEECAKLRAERDALLASTSWAITAPLRAVGRVLRGRRTG